MFFFPACFDAQKGREYQGHLNIFACDDGTDSLCCDNSDISKGLFYMADLLNCNNEAVKTYKFFI